MQSASVGSASDGTGAFLGNMPSGMLIAYNHGDSASGSTGSAISAGTLEVRDPTRQQQDVATLSRDPARANDRVDPIFDKEKEQKRLQQVQLIGEIGSQSMDILRTQGQLDADKAARAELAARGISAPGKGASERQVDDYRKALLATNAYQDIMGKYGTGGDYQKAAQAVIAALQGLAGGDIGSALAGASSPYVAGVIKQVAGDNDTARIMAHAVLGAVVAQAQGNSAAAGATGAAGSELAAQLISERLYGTQDRSKLSEAQKQTISALASLAGGLAGAVVDGSGGGAIAGAAAGRNATENNFLGDGTPPGLISYGQAASSLSEYMRKSGATAEEIAQAQRDLAQGQGFDGAQPANEFIKAWGEAMVAEAAGLGLAGMLGKLGLWLGKGEQAVKGTGGVTKPTVELFGGRNAQTPDAINLDIRADIQSGVRADATKLPFQDGTLGEVIATNPYMGPGGKMMDFLPEATRVVEPGGKIYINANTANPYGKLPSQAELESLGLKIVQNNGTLDPRFFGQTFMQSDGITPVKDISSMKTIVLERIK